ncbi:IS6 family transposase [Paraburkholderia sediminicola]
MNSTAVGVDIAKNVFQVHYVDQESGEIVNKAIKRAKFLEFFANRTPCLIGMEACGGAHHWARQLVKMGHQVRLMPAEFVKAFNIRNKNDAADARAIWLAVQQPGKPVAVKTEMQQAMLGLHRMREQLLKFRTMQSNALRGLLTEYGEVMGKGRAKLDKEMMAERGIEVDHSSVHRWVIKPLPVFEKAFRRRKRPVGRSWRVDETYVKIKGQWKFLYRAVDKAGNTVDFLLRAHRDKAAARRYFEKAIDQNGEPETITVDKSGANLAALEALNVERPTPIKIRQNNYLNNIVEQDHRAVKRIIKPMMGFKDFRCARIILSGIEIAHMIRKGQMCDDGVASTAAKQFYSLVI